MIISRLSLFLLVGICALPNAVRAQIAAGYDNGVRSWMLWNPGSRYTVAALEREAALDAAERPRGRATAPPASSR